MHGPQTYAKWARNAHSYDDFLGQVPSLFFLQGLLLYFTFPVATQKRGKKASIIRFRSRKKKSSTTAAFWHKHPAHQAGTSHVVAEYVNLKLLIESTAGISTGGFHGYCDHIDYMHACAAGQLPIQCDLLPGAQFKGHAVQYAAYPYSDVLQAHFRDVIQGKNN